MVRIIMLQLTLKWPLYEFLAAQVRTPSSMPVVALRVLVFSFGVMDLGGSLSVSVLAVVLSESWMAMV
jgi:hypothetical protein